MAAPLKELAEKLQDDICRTRDSSLDEIEFHGALAELSRCVYRVSAMSKNPCPDTLPSAKEMFLDNGGFRALSFQSEASLPGKSTDRIYAISGTKPFSGVNTVSSALSLGRQQSSGPGVQQVLDDAMQVLKSGRKVTFTGHSQGGITAQILGYLLASYAREKNLKAPQIEVVTFGSPGARPALSELLTEAKVSSARPEARHYDPSLTEKVKFANYSFSSDVFAGIGEHLGDNRRLSDGSLPPSSRLSLWGAHSYDYYVGHFQNRNSRCDFENIEDPGHQVSPWLKALSQTLAPHFQSSVPTGWPRDYVQMRTLELIESRCRGKIMGTPDFQRCTRQAVMEIREQDRANSQVAERKAFQLRLYPLDPQKF